VNFKTDYQSRPLISEITLRDYQFAGQSNRGPNSRLTLDVYAQALTPEKRAAQKKVVEMIQPGEETAVVPLCSTPKRSLLRTDT